MSTRNDLLEQVNEIMDVFEVLNIRFFGASCVILTLDHEDEPICCRVDAPDGWDICNMEEVMNNIE